MTRKATKSMQTQYKFYNNSTPLKEMKNWNNGDFAQRNL